MAEGKRDIISGYRAYLMLEMGLSPNTREAYWHDLEKLLTFLREEGIEPLAVTLDDLHRFTWALKDVGISMRSVARILSGVRAFYHFLVLDEYLEKDPTRLLQAPKIGHRLPTVLTVEEVDRIIASVDMTEREGLRNRTIIEILYSCGLRVSEACDLKVSDLNLPESYLRVKGKGGKERLVPLSPRAVRELKLWLVDREQIKAREGEEDYVFLTYTRGRHLSRITVFHFIKLQAQAAGMRAADLAQYKNDLAFVGGIDAQSFFVNATPDEIRAEVRRVRSVLGPGLVVSPSHEEILPNVPAANILAMAEAAHETA